MSFLPSNNGACCPCNSLPSSSLPFLSPVFFSPNIHRAVLLSQPANEKSIRNLWLPAMLSLVPNRKRKDTANVRWTTRDKDKVRVVDLSGQDLLNSTVALNRPRSSTPASRTFTNLRKGSSKFFSLFRAGKSNAGIESH
jgi:hypothetical protein